MTTVDSPNLNDDGTPILYPYMYNPNSRRRRRERVWAMWLLAGFCLFWGMVFAFMAPALIVVWIAPIAFLALATIWALPDLKTAPTRAVEGLFIAFTMIMGLWPDYLSISLHEFGLPWISFERLVSAPLAVIFLICVSVSPKLRSELADSLSTQRPIWMLLAAFVVIQTYCMFLTPKPIMGIDGYVKMQTTWTLMFFVSAWLFTKPGMVERWVRTLWFCAVLTGLIGIAEWRVHHVLWMGHLPSFLEMDPLVALELMPTYRNYTYIYRVQSVFSTAIGFGEFISLTMPFILNYGMLRLRTIRGKAALLTIPFLFFVAYITNARSALIGLLVGGAAYGFYWGYTQHRLYPEKLFAKAVVLGYPVMLATGFVATLVVGHLRHAIWGGGETASSTDSRSVQYATGIPKILKHFWGYGIGQAGVALDYHEPNGRLTIDTYYLAIALEYGILGFIVYYAMFFFSVTGAGRYAFRDPGKDKECSYLGAAAAVLMAYLVIKSVFAEANNHPLVYMMLGMICALSSRIRKTQEERRAQDDSDASARPRRLNPLPVRS